MLDLNLALLGLILSIVYSSSEIALLSANALQLDVWEKQKIRMAPWASSILDWKPEYLSVILIGTTLSNILATSFATVYLLRADFLPHQLIVLPIAAIILLFGEILPKTIMRKYANYGLLMLSPFLKLSYYLFFPIVLLLRQTGWMSISARYSDSEEELEENKEKIKIDPPPLFFSDEFGGHTIVIPTEEICRDEVNFRGTVVINLYIDNKLSQIRLERANMNDRNLMDFAMKKYGSFRLPQEIDKMRWRGTHRWESDSEYIVYIVSNIQNGSIEIIEITSKLYSNGVAKYYEEFAKRLE